MQRWEKRTEEAQEERERIKQRLKEKEKDYGGGMGWARKTAGEAEQTTCGRNDKGTWRTVKGQCWTTTKTLRRRIARNIGI